MNKELELVKMGEARELLAFGDLILNEAHAILEEEKRVFRFRLIKRSRMLKQTNKLLDQHEKVLNEATAIMQEVENGRRV